MIFVGKKPSSGKKFIITEIKQKIRLLNVITSFIIITLLAVIIRYLYKPVSEALEFLPDISITLIIVIILFLAAIGFYISRVVSKQAVYSIEKYSSRLDRILTITRNLREEIYGDILLNKIMDHSLSITNSDAGAILLIEDDNLSLQESER